MKVKVTRAIVRKAVKETKVSDDRCKTCIISQLIAANNPRYKGVETYVADGQYKDETTGKICSFNLSPIGLKLRRAFDSNKTADKTYKELIKITEGKRVEILV